MSVGVCTIFFGKADEVIEARTLRQAVHNRIVEPEIFVALLQHFATAGLASPGFSSPAM